ncbi:gamma-glutamyl-gamma-aminobutyrate hydrolase family protein [bacterium]|jgi:putative glutamine amidotransferase|nr:gamma-glutamyl-gamma-aminobutyrate hydrolase family protein [bacterium]
MKPLVGVCSDLILSKKDKKPKSVIDCGYVDGIYAAGGIPVVIPPMEREEILEEYVERLDGLLMTGGLDLNPQKMGKRPHPSIKPMLARREDSDRRLLKMAIERKMPTLCVGVSMQLMNVMFGGTLHTHLPEDMPRALPHFDPYDSTHRHTVFVTPTTRLEEIYGEGEIRVNSNHHQGIRVIGKGLRSSALAPDGLVEAIELMDPSWWMVGVQWHPENDSSSALDRQLFEGFIDACLGKASVPLIIPSLKKAS